MYEIKSESRYRLIRDALDYIIDNFPKEDRKKVMEAIVFGGNSLEFSFSGLPRNSKKIKDLPKLDSNDLYLDHTIHEDDYDKDMVGIVFTSMTTKKEVLNRCFSTKILYDNIKNYIALKIKPYDFKLKP